MEFLGDFCIRRFFLILFISCIVCISLVSAADPVSVSSPDVVKPGDPVSVMIGNLKAHDQIGITIDGQIKTIAGSPFFFSIRDLILDFTCDNNPTVGVTLSNLVPESYGEFYIYREGGSSIRKGHNAVGKTWTDTATNPVLNAGTYHVFINGTAERSDVPMRLNITGRCQDDVNFTTISFRTGGFSNGIFNVITQVNSQQVDKKAFTVQDSFLANNG
jgi:hypothetical protein